jgi:hypothetical protein
MNINVNKHLKQLLQGMVLSITLICFDTSLTDRFQLSRLFGRLPFAAGKILATQSLNRLQDNTVARIIT